MTSVLRYFTATAAPRTYLFNCEIKADALQSEIDKLLYFSYRSGFAPLSLNTDPSVSITTDAGWGCTYRAGQMLFAHALNILLLKNNPNWHGLNAQTPSELIEIANQILNLFADVPVESASSGYWTTGRYSIHQCVQCAHSLYRKTLREWIGPDSMASILKVITEQSPQSQVRVVVSRDRIFNPTAVQRAGASGGTWTPVLVIAPLLLGLKSALPNLYIQPLIATLKLAHSLGVIGGRPGAAYWLVGCEEQGEHVTLLALDPHVTRVCSGAPINRTQHATFVSNGVARLKLTELDACLAVAFLCPTARDVDALAQSLAQLADTYPDPLLSVSSDLDSDQSESESGACVSVNLAQDDFDMT